MADLPPTESSPPSGLGAAPSRDAEETAQALRRAEQLLDVSVALNTVREPEHLLSLILDAATSVLGCGAASILLFEEATGRLRFAAATGEGAAALSEVAVPLHGSVAGTIYRENRAVHIRDAAQEEGHFRAASDAVGVRTEALLGVPMRIDGRPVGVFEVLNPEGGAFTDEDERTLLVLAAQAAVAIENVRQRRALATARNRLAELDRLKSDFMALASHELRTPISIILGYGDILREEAQDDLVGFVDTVLDAGGRMHEIVETLEEMSVLQDEEVEIVLEPALLQPILWQAWEQAGGPSADRETRFDVPEEDVVVGADRGRLRVVFGHLFKNALAHTAPGQHVSVRLHCTADAACVQVADTGTGLSESDCQRVFEAFYQVQRPLQRDHEGMGTGLTVSRGLVQAHGGHIWAESAGRGEGSTFHVRLPLVKAKGHTAAPMTKQGPDASAAPDSGFTSML